MTNPLITVVVPIYKVEEYLNRCVDSILSQTYHNLEIILVDDGSPDRCGIICEDYKKKDGRVKVLHKTNGGLSDARNAGIDSATGEYIAFIDSDDFVHQKYLEVLYSHIKNNNADIAACGEQWFSCENEIVNVRESPTEIVFSGIDALEALCYQKTITNSACGKLYNIRLFNDIRYPFGRLYEDMAVIYKLLYNSKKVVCIPGNYYYYFQRNNSIMHQKFFLHNMDRIEISEELLRFVKEKAPNLEEAAISRFFISNVQVLREFPYSDPKYKKEKEIIKKNIRNYRKIVLFDSKAKKVNRCIALFTYLPLSFVKRFGGVYKKYEKKAMKKSKTF